MTASPTPIITLSHPLRPSPAPSLSTTTTTTTLSPILRIHIRPYTSSDAPSMSASANNPSIPINMTNMFPSPYTIADAEWFIGRCCDRSAWMAPSAKAVGKREARERKGEGKSEVDGGEGGEEEEKVPVNYAIVLVSEEREERVVGSIGLKFSDLNEVEARNAEVGYWIAEDLWGHGIMSAVLRPFVDWTWRTFPVLLRLEAGIFGWNRRSGGCLKNAGFREVGTMRGKIWKGGKQTDLVIWELLREG